MSIALTIAGSDSGGGAGIQADLKTFSAFGVYGASVITAITAQNTVGVTAVHEIPLDVIGAQIDAVMTDFRVQVVKTGMLSSAAIVTLVADKLRQYGMAKLVVDPVMVAKSGDQLLHKEAVNALRTELMPLALVVTPNIPEAEVLAELTIRGESDRREAARRIGSLGPRYVVIKGGHLPGEPVDLLWDGAQFNLLEGPRVDSTSTHGTGCTFASAIAASLAQGAEIGLALRTAKLFVTEAIAHAQGLGHGHGPLNHNYKVQLLEASRGR